jgi:hypothetical protein
VFLKIDKWTSGFMVFDSVLLKRFPSKLQEMFKYTRDIRLAANRSSGWYRYEEKFRLKVANNPNILPDWQYHGGNATSQPKHPSTPVSIYKHDRSTTR